MMAQIYGLIDPRDGALRYIGTANDAEKRLATHHRDSRKRDTPVYRWIRKLALCGHAPDILVLSTCVDWVAEERRLIASARRQGYRLLNVADGGDEPHCPEETRRSNAIALNEKRKTDPFAFAAHGLLRWLGQSVRQLQKDGSHEVAARLAAQHARLQKMDRDWLAYQMSFIPRMWRFFPNWCHEELRGGTDVS